MKRIIEFDGLRAFAVLLVIADHYAPFRNFANACGPALLLDWDRQLERETGIEPATNSLEGCDSTTELLPPGF